MTQNELEFLKDALLYNCERILQDIVANDTFRKKQEKSNKKEKSE